MDVDGAWLDENEDVLEFASEESGDHLRVCATDYKCVKAGEGAYLWKKAENVTDSDARSGMCNTEALLAYGVRRNCLSSVKNAPPRCDKSKKDTVCLESGQNGNGIYCIPKAAEMPDAVDATLKCSASMPNDSMKRCPNHLQTTDGLVKFCRKEATGLPVGLSKEDLSKEDLPEIDPPEIDPLKTDLPKIDPLKTDLPKMDPLKTELPKIDPLKTDLPKMGPLKTELPKIGPLKTDLPKIDPLKTDLPKIDPPKADPPQNDHPGPQPMCRWFQKQTDMRQSCNTSRDCAQTDDSMFEAWWAKRQEHFAKTVALNNKMTRAGYQQFRKNETQMQKIKRGEFKKFSKKGDFYKEVVESVQSHLPNTCVEGKCTRPLSQAVQQKHFNGSGELQLDLDEDGVSYSKHTSAHPDEIRALLISGSAPHLLRERFDQT